ncbi:ABC transporter permease [Paeniglutamicibacter psychrophenolicus]|uniref:ABC-type nitrate/sulfonate/bicarbonate transport system permease component n=1 Tax=Paeniglutamicibacter psychrophenolicus TaxID=257454 RepID=A0ABS4W9G1_9MICC|nr:ABC transporter permease [Paeniglutamicibacter psychrophenolicus]MBP2372768.1 ABC-type nitrate/sulfonate/bicarbonate transport system permease component [Paeniglutamicibacter psychrophenolicus]
MTSSVALKPVAPAAPRQRPSRVRRRFALHRLLGPATILAVFGLWEISSRSGLLPQAAIPPASQVLAAFGAQLVEPHFWLSVWGTLSVALLGLLIIAAIATPLALLIGASREVQESTWFPIEFLKPIPPVALIPLGLLLWGPTPGMKLFLVVFGAIWPLLTQLVYGFKEIDGVARDMARSYRLGKWLTITRVIIPSILPFGATGLRVSASIAVVIAVVAEMIGGVAGLGQDIVVAQSANAMPQMYALIFAAGLLGLLVNAAFRAAEKPLLFWHPSQRKDLP